MGSKHNLMEYAFAQDIVADYPIIKKQLDDTEKVLYKYSKYALVQHSLQSIHESQEMLVRQFAYYKDVLKKKGKE